MQSIKIKYLDSDKPYTSHIKYNKLHNSSTGHIQTPSLNPQNHKANCVKHRRQSNRIISDRNADFSPLKNEFIKK